MSERRVVLDEPAVQDEALQSAVERAERAEEEVARLKHASGTHDATEPVKSAHAVHDPSLRGIEALRQDAMMTHLLNALHAGKDIGHYGRLVFAMTARHFLSDDEVIAELTKDPDFSVDQAVGMLRQVENRDYTPPRRERILEWQAEQDFQILPEPQDPDCGNVYRSLRFPSDTYEHIEHYAEEKSEVA